MTGKKHQRSISIVILKNLIRLIQVFRFTLIKFEFQIFSDTNQRLLNVVPFQYPDLTKISHERILCRHRGMCGQDTETNSTSLLTDILTIFQSGGELGMLTTTQVFLYCNTFVLSAVPKILTSNLKTEKLPLQKMDEVKNARSFLAL